MAYKQHTFISHSSGTGKSRSKVPAWLGSVESPPFVAEPAASLCPHMVEEVREGDLSGSYKGIKLIHECSDLMT